MRILTILLACALLAPCKSVSGRTNDGNVTETFAKSARLKSLKNSNANELRIWYSFQKRVSGVVVTDQNYTYYSNKYSSHLEISKRTASRKELLNYLPALASHEGESFVCDTGIHGGAFFHIEGVYNGSQFSFEAMHTQSCKSEGFDLINAVLRDSGYIK